MSTDEYGEWLVGRVRKNERRSRDAMGKASTDAVRIYDRDIPEIPLTIERYGAHLHVAMWSRGQEQDPGTRTTYLQAATATLAASLGIDSASVHFHARVRESDPFDERPPAVGRPVVIVGERGLQFEVDLGRAIDTGLALDHRLLRDRVADACTGRHCLNLFGGTGTFAVVAAAANAATTKTIEASAFAGDWARRNLRLNGLPTDGRNSIVCADVFGWIDDELHGDHRYDVIVCNAPTFAKSRRLRAGFDVARDHAPLLERVVDLLAPGGTLLFCSTQRSFDLDGSVLDRLRWREISPASVPADFRDRKVHRAWWAER